MSFLSLEKYSSVKFSFWVSSIYSLHMPQYRRLTQLAHTERLYLSDFRFRIFGYSNFCREYEYEFSHVQLNEYNSKNHLRFARTIIAIPCDFCSAVFRMGSFILINVSRLHIKTCKIVIQCDSLTGRADFAMNRVCISSNMQ